MNPITLFLDIDGVLNSHLYELKVDKMLLDSPCIDPDACSKLLSAIIAAPQVDIVISSSWRNTFSLEGFKELFQASLSPYIRDVVSKDLDKNKAIEKYIQDNQLSYESVIILDDDILFDIDHTLSKRQVKTSFYAGLTPTVEKELHKKIKDCINN